MLAEELARPDQISLARQKIKHIVFIVKENRTFDHMFGRFPGADGATSGWTCDGERVPLRPAGDRVPEIDHGFVEGLVAINGGRMDCFDRLGGGEDLDSYLTYDREGIPNYWALAEHFTLADRFFSSIYGPTGVEHMWVIASQSDRFVDMERRGQHRDRRAAGTVSRSGRTGVFLQRAHRRGGGRGVPAGRDRRDHPADDAILDRTVAL